FAGREGDIVSLSNAVSDDPDPMGTVEQRVAWMREGAGDRMGDLDVESMVTYFEITDDVDGTLERVAAAFGNIVSPEVLRDHPLVLVGSLDQVVERLEERRERLAVNYVTVPYHFLDAFAPVVEQLTGK